MDEEGYKPIRDVAKALIGDAPKKPYLVVSAAIYVAGRWFHKGDEVKLDKEQAKEWLTKNAVEALHNATRPVENPDDGDE